MEAKDTGIQNLGKDKARVQMWALPTAHQVMQEELVVTRDRRLGIDL